jgi:hypothetical protein
MRIRVDKKICDTYVKQQNALYFEIEHLESQKLWAGKPVLVAEDADALWYEQEPDNGLPVSLRKLTGPKSHARGYGAEVMRNLREQKKS